MDYGDGTGLQPLTLNAGKTFTLSHTYKKTGTYLVTVTVTDDDGGVGTDTIIVRLAHAPKVALIKNKTLKRAESPLSLGGHFSDSPSTSWTASVDYGDGSGIQPLALKANKTFTLNHLYADSGLYTVTVTVTGEAGSTGSAVMQVTVKNVAPMVYAGSDVTAGLSGGLA